ncbi:hypothetical protein P152DRAFT_491156 [Eremomyces bilateralis CBS 781.70]|uniref:Uncharacterized protein n=1 Tax=Eremomyces bilateralis CBS 781.70 TaxID=1392243 RepID=A0A6G1FYF7_9PEZI|nr:uncharacterized protein P152DRAFT_491156 [Eremomyces bilateralis CBS 781.70]KAF1810706.1 hypothetical protein P152DRAFT_491156 [Eremomyces bilateralis CBS 781.70]
MPIQWDAQNDALLFACIVKVQPLTRDAKEKILEIWPNENPLTMRALEQHITAVVKRGMSGVNGGSAQGTPSKPKATANGSATDDGARPTPKKRGRKAKDENASAGPKKRVKQDPNANGFADVNKETKANGFSEIKSDPATDAADEADVEEETTNGATKQIV